jgi:predicted ATPase
MKISKINIHNLLGFRDFSVEFGELNVLVGPNNGGKTGVMKLLWLAIETLNAFQRPQPHLMGRIEPTAINIQQQLSKVGLDIAKLFYQKKNREKAALELEIETTQGSVRFHIKFEINAQAILTMFIGGKSVAQTPDSMASIFDDLSPLKLEFVGPMGAIREELMMTWQSVEQQVNQGNFAETWRNRLHWSAEEASPEQFEKVAARIEGTLAGVRLHRPRRTKGGNPAVDVSYDEEGILYDVSVSGDGQRTLTGVTAALELSKATVLLFDEPDSHLHPAAQRDVAMYLASAASEQRQIIVATHAPDFIEEIPVESMIWIDRQKTCGRTCAGVAKVLVDLGALTKGQAIRFLGGSDVFLYFEGKLDQKALTRLMRRCGKEEIGKLCRTELLHGFGDVSHLPSAIRILQQIVGVGIKAAVLRDADYSVLNADPAIRTLDGVLELRLPVKEIENLLLSGKTFRSAIDREILRRNDRSKVAPSVDELEAKIDEHTGSKELRHVVWVQWLFQHIERKRPSHAGDIKEAEEEFETLWNETAWRRRCCPGKEVLKSLRSWIQQSLKLTLSDDLLFECYEPSLEIHNLFDALEGYVRPPKAPQ